MSKINIPGFTAEDSVYKTNGHYYRADTLNTRAVERKVLPQLRRFDILSPDYVGCLGGCAQWCQVTEVEGEFTLPSPLGREPDLLGCYLECDRHCNLLYGW
jgi:hypothetical protein